MATEVDWTQHDGDDHPPITRALVRLRHRRGVLDASVRDLARYYNRSLVTESRLVDLEAKIRNTGGQVIHPVVLSVDPDSQRAILADGHHRLGVAMRLCLDTVPLLLELPGDPTAEGPIRAPKGQPYCGTWPMPEE